MSGAVVITGCSTGIGRACAVRLSRAGFRVFAGVRRQEDVESLRTDGPAGLVPVIFDVNDAASVEAVAERISSEVAEQGLRGLVNNAGISYVGPLEFVDIDEVRRVLETNLLGPLRVTQAFLPLIRAGGGRIINIGSGEGFLATPINAPYCMSKFGLEALSESLRLELLPWNIPVSVIEPGHTTTKILEKGGKQVSELPDTLQGPAYALYEQAIRARHGMSDREGLSPDLIARAVQRALTARRPRPRYFVGMDVRAAAFLGRIVPARLRVMVFIRLLGFPRAGSGSSV